MYNGISGNANRDLIIKIYIDETRYPKSYPTSLVSAVFKPNAHFNPENPEQIIQ